MKDLPQIVVIDNHLETCLLLEDIFNTLEISSAFIGTWKDAEQYLYGIRPAVIMINAILPDGYGIDFIPEIRKNVPNSRIIAMSEQIDTQTKFHAFDAGANEFLEIPFTLNQLYQAVINPKVMT
jgi:DNA-binding NtrC family response regulator